MLYLPAVCFFGNSVSILTCFGIVQNRAWRKSLNSSMKNPYGFAKKLFEQSKNGEFKARQAVEAHSAFLENFLGNLGHPTCHFQSG